MEIDFGTEDSFDDRNKFGRSESRFLRSLDPNPDVVVTLGNTGDNLLFVRSVWQVSGL